MAFEPTGFTADALASLDEALAAAGRAAATLDALLPRLDVAQRWAVVARIGEVSRATDALRVRIADDLAKRHAGLPRDERFPVACGYTDPADMLATELGATRRTARRLLDVAAATSPSMSITGASIAARYPILGNALATGSVSLESASAIIDTLGDATDRAKPEHVAAAETALVASAIGMRGMHPAETGVVDRAMPPELLSKVAAKWRDAIDPDGVEPRYDEQLDARSFSFATRPDGLVAGRFVCTADQGAVLATAFDAFTRPKSPSFRSDDGSRGKAERSVDDRTRGQKMVDAFIAMLRSAVERKDVPRVGGEAPTVVLHLSKQALDAAAAGERGGTATDERTGVPIPVHVAVAAGCDGFIQNEVTGADGLPLFLGRKKRFFNRAQRRALAIRDGGCRAPGCTSPVGWCDAHHIVPWIEGGGTDITNGILLCPFHHHEVHRGALEVLWATGGWVVVPKVRPPRRRRGWAIEVQPEQLYLQHV